MNEDEKFVQAIAIAPLVKREHLVSPRMNGKSAIAIAPTRELASQVAKEHLQRPT